MTEKLAQKDLPSPKTDSMSLSDLSDSIINDIVSIYDEVATSKLAREFIEEEDVSQKLHYVQEMFEFSNAVAWRFGSRLSPDTKMYLWKAGWKEGSRLIQFSFDPNIGVSDPLGMKIAEFDELVQSFKRKVNQYLSDHQLNQT